MAMPMIDVVVPDEQEGTKAIVRSWLRGIGDTVSLDDPLVELETDKVTQEVPAPAAGILVEIVLTADAEAVPGAVLGRLRQTDEPAVAEPAGRALSPAVRSAIKEYGIDPEAITGSGRAGRITREDVDRFVASRPKADAVPATVAKERRHRMTTEASQPAPTAIASGVERIPHDRMRLAVAENMLNSVMTAPHVTAVFEADFSAILAHQRAHKAEFQKRDANLTLTSYFVAASVTAMRAAPAINSRWHPDSLEIFNDVNIGIGTALGDKGLVVPVVHQAQTLSLLDIAVRLTDLTRRARTNSLTPADTRSGTFTISNHGVSGSLLASPIIIVQPQSAILGVGKVEKRVAVRTVGGVDTIQIRPMCYVTLTVDHRAVDGHQTNAWLSAFVATLEDWAS